MPHNLSIDMGGIGNYNLQVAPHGTTGHIYIYGMQWTSAASGVEITQHSIAGCQAACFSGATSNAFIDLIPQGIQLVIIPLGVNEAIRGISPSTFQTNLLAMVQHYQSYTSNPKIVLLAEPWQKTVDMTPYYAAMQSVATATNAVLFN